MSAGQIVAIAPWAGFTLWVLASIARDLCRWFDYAEPLRMSDVVHPFAEPDMEDEIFERLRRQLDAEDAKDPRLIRELQAEARMWSEVAELELAFALPCAPNPKVRG